MSWLSILILILSFTFTFNNVSEAGHQKRKLPSAVVVGTVYCDTCFHQEISKSSHFISGALIAVECGDTGTSKPRFREEVKTDENGEFRVHLPFSVSKHVKKIKGCSVKLISSSEPYCAVASSATSSSLHLKSKKPGTHIFSAGFFTFKPLKQPQLCNQKPSIHNSKEFNSRESVSNRNTLGFPFPPNPFFPPSLFPPNPLQPPSLFPPNPLQPPSLFPPNPLQPPPSLLPPNPFQPPPSLLPPIFPSPPPSLFPPNIFPPIPGLIPSPPPPPPAFPIPLPPFPFQPIPGIPPATPPKKTSP